MKKLTLIALLFPTLTLAYTPTGIPDYTISDTIGASNVTSKTDVYSFTCDVPTSRSTLEVTAREGSTFLNPSMTLQVLSGTWASSITSMAASINPSTGVNDHAATVTTTAYENQIGPKTYTIKVVRPKHTSGITTRTYSLFVRCSTDPATDHALTFTQTTNQ